MSPIASHVPARKRREGAAMLIVMMVLLMTTATATFAVHSTSMEIRSSGYARQAQQTEYVAVGGAYAGVAYVEGMKASGSLIQYLRTNVAAGTASSLGEASVDQATNLLRIELTDFPGSRGVVAPPLELDATGTPFLGHRNAYVPSFTVDGTDLYQYSRDEAGRDLTGRGARYYRMSLTSRGRMAPPTDYRAVGDDRDYHELAMRTRAITEVGPFWLEGH